MAGYVLADIEVTDADGYAEYRDLATAAVEQYGGRYLVRGGPSEVLEGDITPHRLVVLEFPTVDDAQRFYSSAEYQAAAQVRRRHSRGWMVVVEGS